MYNLCLSKVALFKAYGKLTTFRQKLLCVTHSFFSHTRMKLCRESFVSSHKFQKLNEAESPTHGQLKLLKLKLENARHVWALGKNALHTAISGGKL